MIPIGDDYLLLTVGALSFDCIYFTRAFFSFNSAFVGKIFLQYIWYIVILIHEQYLHFLPFSWDRGCHLTACWI